ncbi:iron ABC transporter [Limnochorda pilosa]|uniref:Iron ABC transporter n=1 Tax=Limnochorda pilosa TaxID=1555112 RepID=A0A0K2SR74_LIMPI|nr:iron ABC transporter [Limnochorda pilosa]
MGAPARVARRRPGTLLMLTAAWVAVAFLALWVGSVRLPPAEVVHTLLERLPGVGGLLEGSSVPASHQVILWQIRLPRILLAGGVGAVLAFSGAVLQGLFRNPMADPFVLGLSGGAAAGAVASLAMGVGFRPVLSFLPFPALPLFAFAGGLGSVILVYSLALEWGRARLESLLLSGLAVGAVMSAVVSLLLLFSGEDAHKAIFWLMGSLGAASWERIRAVLPYLVLGGLGVLPYLRELNALLLGEEPAAHLGVEVERVRRRLIGATALMTAAAVSVSGVIGFVGLITPHVVRLLLGPDHRRLVPASALAGAILLTLTDTVARTLLAPVEIPVGALTALMGGPFFLALLRRRRESFFGGST